MLKLVLAAVVLGAACSPQDVLNRQGQTLRSTDYVQVALEEKKKEDAKRAEEERKRQAEEANVQKHVDKGQAHMDLFEYEQAVTEYKEAYRLSQEPSYLVSVGDALRATGDCVEAQNMYAQYMFKRKDAPDRPQVQRKIDEAQRCEKAAGSNLAQIRKHYKAGTTHYDLAEYDKAAAEFKEAYRLSNDPAYLFNIGQAYRMAKRCDDAARFYERFLAVEKDAPNRERVEKRLTEMKACAKSK